MSDFFTQKAYVLDGATMTRLRSLGMPGDACVPAWILGKPEAYLRVERSYVRAGSDLLYAPTGGASAPLLKKNHVRLGVRRVNRQLVELAREGADGRPVGGVLAGSGLRVEPMDGAAFDEIVKVYAEQAAALEEAGVDFFAAESQPSLAECRAAVVAIRSVSEKPILTTFTCTNTGRTAFGEDLCAALLCLQDMAVEAFGVNCCENLGLVSRILSKLKPYASIPLAAKPNAGAAVQNGAELSYRMTPAKLAAYVPRFVAGGARLIGGCCGTDEESIAAVRRTLDAMEIPDFVPAAPQKTVAASAFRLIELTPRLKIEELEIDEDIVENAAVSEAVGTKLLKVELRDELDVDLLAEAQYAIRLPLAVSCGDGELLRRFLRVYNGKPVLL